MKPDQKGSSCAGYRAVTRGSQDYRGVSCTPKPENNEAGPLYLQAVHEKLSKAASGLKPTPFAMGVFDYPLYSGHSTTETHCISSDQIIGNTTCCEVQIALVDASLHKQTNKQWAQSAPAEGDVHAFKWGISRQTPFHC
ncbi:hypothetical protein J6590_072923 [Homalodisca vitripennis]|nr:hypothetical protein J6590_072923 [Homalodisca vitripennis]